MENAEVDLRRVFGLIGRRLPLIVAVTLASICTAMAVLMVMVPVYSATSLIVFDPLRKDLLEPVHQTSSGPADNARIESEVELLRSDTILLKVMAAQDLLNDPDFAPKPGLKSRILVALGLWTAPPLSADIRLGQVLASLRAAISVQRRGLTYLIAIQAQSADPVQAATLANAVAQTYIDDQLAAKVNAMLASRDVLQARLAQARGEIVSSEAEFNAFMAQSTLQLASGPGGSAVQRLALEIDTLADTRLRLDQRAQTVMAGLSNKDWSGLAALLQAEQNSVLEQQRQALAAQLSAIDRQSPAARQMLGQLASLEKEIAQSAEGQLVDLRTQIASMDAQQASLREALHSTIMQSDLPADILTGLFDLQSKAAFARDHYQLLLNRSLELQNQSGLQVADSRMASPALPPSQPSFPNTTIFLAIALFTGLCLGVVVSAIYEAVVGGFMSEEQIEAALKTRVAAVVPRVKLQSGNDILADLIITAPLSQFSEAMRRTRFAIDQASPSVPADRGPLGRVVMVTSAAPGEGKSTLAMALARSYALSGRRTLLIDCDLRQPAIGERLDIVPRQGLLEVLEARRSAPIALEPVLRHETDTGLALLLGTQGTDRPTDTLLASARFERLLDEALHMFEIVLLDTPPIAPVVDALYVARRADVIVLVTRWASTAQRETRQAMASLLQAKRPSAPIVSLLNGKDEPRATRKQQSKQFYDVDYA